MDARLAAWLETEIQSVEAQLAGHPPMCALDRKGAAPPGLKELEGRYAVLRRARKLLATGGDLVRLDEDAQKARLIAQASRDGGPQWAGYARGVTSAIEDIRRLSSGSAPLMSSNVGTTPR